MFLQSCLAFTNFNFNLISFPCKFFGLFPEDPENLLLLSLKSRRVLLLFFKPGYVSKLTIWKVFWIITLNDLSIPSLCFFSYSRTPIICMWDHLCLSPIAITFSDCFLSILFSCLTILLPQCLLLCFPLILFSQSPSSLVFISEIIFLSFSFVSFWILLNFNISSSPSPVPSSELWISHWGGFFNI